MGKLRINLLGGLEARRADGTVISFPARKAALLLAVLATAAGRPQSRTALCGLLWGDRGDTQARGSLRQALSILRKSLDGIEPFPLTSDRSSVTLDEKEIELDVTAFESRARSNDAAALEAATQLYRGPFLDGDDSRDAALQEWLGRERARLHEIAVDALGRLGELSLAAADHDGAQRAARRLLELDPICEAGHRTLMRAQAARGQRGAALAQYQGLRDLLAGELGVEPEDETVRLQEELLSGSPAPRQQPEPPSPGDVGSGPHGGPAVAILPFENLGGGPEDDYLIDGITEDAIDALARWRWFPVIGRNSTLGYRDTDKPPETIGRELGARYLVTGSIRRAGERLRIAVQLIDAETGRQHWSNRYDTVISDIFAVQDEICEGIAGSIEPELIRAEERRAATKRPADMTAWDHVLRASWIKSRDGQGYGTRDGNAEAMGHLRKALELDPDSSQAMAVLAQCLWHDCIMGWTGERDAALAEALDLTRHAVAVDDGNWRAYTTLGIVHVFALRQPGRAVELLDRAVSLNPSASLALHCLGCALEFRGRPAEAIPHLDSVFRLDPRYRGAAAALADLGLCNVLLGEYATAVEYLQRSLATEPGYLRGRQRLVAALQLNGEHEAAASELQSLIRDQPGFNGEYVESTYPFENPEHTALLLDALRAAGLRD